MTSHDPNEQQAIMHDGELGSPDAHGQAAMLLVESLIHGLIARSVITPADAVEIVETAAEVKQDIAASLGDSAAALRKSLSLLEGVADSLRQDTEHDWV